MNLKEQYKKETGNYAFDLQKRPTKDYVEWLENRCDKNKPGLRFIDTTEKEPEVGGYYFCNVWLEDNTHPTKALIEWTEKKAANESTYWDWGVNPIELEIITKIEWLDGLKVHN